MEMAISFTYATELEAAEGKFKMVAAFFSVNKARVSSSLSDWDGFFFIFFSELGI